MLLILCQRQYCQQQGSNFLPVLDFTTLLNPVLLALVIYFLKRTMDRLDAVEKSISGEDGLSSKVAVLLDRDRNKRLTDYAKD